MDAERATETVERGLRISGRVQGVGFRWWTTRLARELGLRGVVYNRPDGDVEIRAVGSGERLDELERRVRSGPAAARVEAVRRKPSSLELPEHGFEIVG